MGEKNSYNNNIIIITRRSFVRVFVIIVHGTLHAPNTRTNKIYRRELKKTARERERERERETERKSDRQEETVLVM